MSSNSVRTDLFVHGKQLQTIFELLGSDENDLTRSLGWTLSRCPLMAHQFLRKLCPEVGQAEISKITIQEYRSGDGVTDLELLGEKFHLILEAKRGWVLPQEAQLTRYARCLKKSPLAVRSLIVVSECTPAYATRHLPTSVIDVPLRYLSWGKVEQLAGRVEGRQVERYLCKQFCAYLRRTVKMQDQESNLVFVVALGSGRPSWSSISWKDIVLKRRRYFHPAGKHWPKVPPNYLGFRFDGRLQQICHITSWKIVENVHSEIPEINAGKFAQHLKRGNLEPHFVYQLGNPVVPSRPVLNGGIYASSRLWVMLDLLLTCGTVEEARDLTRERLEGSQR